MNTINTNAIAALNQDRQAAVVDQAQAKIVYILKEQDTIKSCEAAIKEHQEILAKLAEDVLTADMVLGRPASATPTINEATILKAIKERNDERAKAIEGKSKSHITAVDGHKKTIASCNERIAKLREEMNSLAVDVVSAEQVLG